MKRAAFLALAAIWVGSCSSVPESERDRGAVWSVSVSADPITGVRRCVVAALDRVMGGQYSRTGYLYPFIEANSKSGLLVGVSSGGRFRLPSGDVLWRVDNQPYRELRATDNPTSATSDGTAMGDLTREQMRLIQTATATATVASGERAEEMLREMLAGRTLIFRSANVAPSYGLPSERTTAVGQITSDGLRPYALDESFRNGLAQCGIEMRAADDTIP